jgi:hypothetical protein
VLLCLVLYSTVEKTALATSAEPTALTYVKKHSIGMDEYRYLDKAVDAVACAVNAFASRDGLDHTLTSMFQGSAHRHQGGAVQGDGSAEQRDLSWLHVATMVSPTAFARALPTTIVPTPLLAAPLLDVLVFSAALAKAAPASSADSAVSPAKAARNPLHAVAYHPLWNLQPALRSLCVARLVQLVVREIDEHGCSWTGDDDEALAAFPSISVLLHAILNHPVLVEMAARRQSTPVGEAAAWAAKHTQHVVVEWVAFLRASAHFVYRTCAPLVAASGGVENGLCPPQWWLQETVAPMLVVSSVDVTDAQVRKHLVCVPELLANEGTITAVPSELATAVGAWLSDLAHWNAHRAAVAQLSMLSVDVGISTQAEVNAAISTESAMIGGRLPGLKVSTTTSPPSPQSHRLVPHYLHPPAVSACYPRLTRAQLIRLPREYTKLHAQVMSRISAHRASHPDAPVKPSAEGKAGDFEHPALCLVCAAVVDAGGRGQCAAHAVTCGGESGVFFLLQVVSLY